MGSNESFLTGPYTDRAEAWHVVHRIARYLRTHGLTPRYGAAVAGYPLGTRGGAASRWCVVLADAEGGTLAPRIPDDILTGEGARR